MIKITHGLTSFYLMIKWPLFFNLVLGKYYTKYENAVTNNKPC